MGAQISLLAVILGLAGPCVQGPEMTAKQVLARVSQQLDSLRSIIVKSETTATGSSELTKVEQATTYSSSELRSDGRRFRVQTRSWGDLNKTTHVAREKALYKSRLWDGETYFQFDKSIHLTHCPTPHGTAILTRGRQVNLSIRREETTIKEYPSHVLFGVFSADVERVDLILRQSGKVVLAKSMEQVGEVSCYVLTGKTQRGAYTLWVAPSHNYSIARAEVVRGPGDEVFFHNNKLMALESITESLTNVVFERVGNVWVPTAGESGGSRRFPEGQIEKSKCVHKQNVVQLNPDHKALKSFQPDDIENGARVILSGDNTRYLWEDGKYAVDTVHPVPGKIQSEDRTASPPSSAPMMPQMTRRSIVSSAPAANTAQPTK